jgi:spore coat protein CotH
VEQVPGQDPLETGETAYVFDSLEVRDYSFTLTPQDWGALNDDPAAEQYFEGVLTFEGQDFDPVGLRYKGSYGSLFWCVDRDGELTPGGALGDQPCTKLSMKMSFNEYDSEGRFYGVKKLAFNSMDADPSRMRERLIFTLFGQFDVPAPRAVHAQLTVNGELMGLFTVVETIDGRFAREHFAQEGGEGNVYKEVWPTDSDESDWERGLKTNRDENPDHSPVLQFSRDLEAAYVDGSAEAFLGVLDEWTDRDSLMRFLAVDRATENWDGIMAWYGSRNAANHNYYWYQETAGERIWLLPWDTDRSLVAPNPIVHDYGMPRWIDDPGDCGTVTVFRSVAGRAPSCDPLIAGLAEHGWEDYAAASRTLLDTVMSEQAVEELLSTWEAQISEHVANDPRGVSTQEWVEAMAELRADVAVLRSDISGQIEAR